MEHHPIRYQADGHRRATVRFRRLTHVQRLLVRQSPLLIRSLSPRRTFAEPLMHQLLQFQSLGIQISFYALLNVKIIYLSPKKDANSNRII